jgi:hypothetical protein
MQVNTWKSRRKPYDSEGKYPDVDGRVLEWVREERVSGNAVTMATIRKKAAEVGAGTDFKASEGWASASGQMIPSDAQEQALPFLKHVEHVIGSQQLTNSQLANMDETPVYFDLWRNSMIDLKGLGIIHQTTRHEKLRVTVVLTALASGHTRRKVPA